MREFAIFARQWTPGRVKTRLAAVIGNAAAAEVYQQSVLATLQRFASLGDRRSLMVTPPESVASMQMFAGAHWRCRAQAEGDLGERMSAYFAEAFTRGATQVVLIGSDSPTLPTQFVTAAFERLQVSDCVLGPAEDGGYYLLGLSRFIPELFLEMPWSKPNLLEQTEARLKEVKAAFALLPMWRDFDTVEDLHRLRVELAKLAPQNAVYLSLLNAIGRALPLCH
jgi:rSAM/selenodomain-associated transferase 1